MKPREVETIFKGWKYSTKNSMLLAGDDYEEGNYEREGTNKFLYKTPNNRYFYVFQQDKKIAPDKLVPISPDEAMQLYAALPVRRIDFSKAFPNVEIKDA